MAARRCPGRSDRQDRDRAADRRWRAFVRSKGRLRRNRPDTSGSFRRPATRKRSPEPSFTRPRRWSLPACGSMICGILAAACCWPLVYPPRSWRPGSAISRALWCASTLTRLEASKGARSWPPPWPRSLH